MMNTEYVVLKTIKTNDPHRAAAWFQTLLAVDRGVGSRMESSAKRVIVIADDNRAVRFER